MQRTSVTWSLALFTPLCVLATACAAEDPAGGTGGAGGTAGTTTTGGMAGTTASGGTSGASAGAGSGAGATGGAAGSGFSGSGNGGSFDVTADTGDIVMNGRILAIGTLRQGYGGDIGLTTLAGNITVAGLGINTNGGDVFGGGGTLFIDAFGNALMASGFQSKGSDGGSFEVFAGGDATVQGGVEINLTALDVEFGFPTRGTPGTDDFDVDGHRQDLADLAALGVTWTRVGVPGASLAAALEGLEAYGELVISPSRA